MIQIEVVNTIARSVWDLEPDGAIVLQLYRVLPSCELKLLVQIANFEGEYIHQETISMDENPELFGLWDFKAEVWIINEVFQFIDGIKECQ